MNSIVLRGSSVQLDPYVQRLSAPVRPLYGLFRDQTDLFGPPAPVEVKLENEAQEC